MVSNVTVEKGCWPKFDLDTAGRTVYFAGFFVKPSTLRALR